ncbi:MAG: hypothetical protein L0228_08175 [Planctomycetes bacterium]|nr:hypothetical protein [Planctomycetota bacterium]
MSRGYRKSWCAVACGAVIALTASAQDARAGAIRFLVAEFPGQAQHHDSYVLPLSDPAAIAHARELIKSGLSAGAPIVVAEIAAGANGINRNYLAPGSPPWSWHVTRFESFADFTIEILDGWPGYVEENAERWIANTGGYIGFWTYTVVAELPTGDYDADLDVDLDDYAAWKRSFGSMTDLSADGNGDGNVDVADYVVWRKSVAAVGLVSPASGQRGAVPEPTAALMATWLAFLMRMRRVPR